MKFLLALLLSMTGVSQVQADTQGQSHMHGPRTTVYMVADMARAKAWDSEAFGIAPYFDEAYYIGFNVRGYELGLMAADASEKATSVIAYWGIDDADAAYDRLVGLGATPLNPVSDVGGGIRLGVVNDPFGNALGVIYNPHFNSAVESPDED